jgi:hypothetical protein
MSGVEVRFVDVDGDGDREVIVETSWLRAVLRFPEKLGLEYYKRRFTWGGRLQSLVYRPTGREFFLTRMVDLEDINPFGLPDELFATFPLTSEEGGRRYLKMGVGVFETRGEEKVFSPLPWTWREEEAGAERLVIFRQEVEDLEGYSYVYEKHYRFRPEAAFFALDIVWENRGSTALASAWDIHSFHVAGVPPHTAWLLAPKRAWISCGQSRVRAVLKEASPIFATPAIDDMVSDRLQWDMDGTPWWYALGPGDGEEFYLLRARFEPDWGMFWAGYGAFTPQGIAAVVVPPGERAIWGFDVTLGQGGRNFVAAGEDGGLTLDREPGQRQAVAGVHQASRTEGCLQTKVMDQAGALHQRQELAGTAAPGQSLSLSMTLPEKGDYAVVELLWQQGDAPALQAREIVPLAAARPTARLPFSGGGKRIFVAVHHALEKPEADGRYLYCHGTQTGFEVNWAGPGPASPEEIQEYRAICLVGDAWPLAHVEVLRGWVKAGGGLLLCAPFGQLAAALADWMPLLPLAETSPPQPSHVVVSGTGMPRYAESEWMLEADGDGSPRIWRQLHTQTLERVDPVVGLRGREPHYTTARLMLEPDAKVRIGYWVPASAHPEARVTLEFTDAAHHPAVGLRAIGQGRLAAVASRPAWGTNYRKVVWDGWGQYHRAFWAGLMGWAAGTWVE